jgi:hypothetical protein
VVGIGAIFEETGAPENLTRKTRQFKNFYVAIELIIYFTDIPRNINSSNIIALTLVF